VYPVREEHGRQIFQFYPGIDQEHLCLGVPREEVMPEGCGIDKEHVRDESVGRALSLVIT